MNKSFMFKLLLVASIVLAIPSCYEGESVWEQIDRLEEENYLMEGRIAELLESEEKLEKQVEELEDEKEELEQKVSNLEDIIERARGELEWNRDIEYAIDILNEWW